MTQFKKKMSEDILRYIEENYNGEISPPTLWDAAKAVLRCRLIAVASAKKRQKNNARVTKQYKSAWK